MREEDDSMELPRDFPAEDVLAYARGTLPDGHRRDVEEYLEALVARQASGVGDDEVRRLLREADPDIAFAFEADPPGQAELLAWVAREMRYRLRVDRLWVLAAAAPLKLLLARRALRSEETTRSRIAAGASAVVLTIAVLRHALGRRR
jgi:hypothetical protein